MSLSREFNKIINSHQNWGSTSHNFNSSLSVSSFHAVPFFSLSLTCTNAIIQTDCKQWPSILGLRKMHCRQNNYWNHTNLAVCDLQPAQFCRCGWTPTLNGQDFFWSMARHISHWPLPVCRPYEDNGCIQRALTLILERSIVRHHCEVTLRQHSDRHIPVTHCWWHSLDGHLFAHNSAFSKTRPTSNRVPSDAFSFIYQKDRESFHLLKAFLRHVQAFSYVVQIVVHQYTFTVTSMLHFF